MAKDTNLTRKEYTQKANDWLRDNPKTWKYIRENSKHPFTVLQEQVLTPLFGKPKWQDHANKKGKQNPKTGLLPTKENKGVDFIIENKGNNRIGYKSAPLRKVTRGSKTGGTRAVNEKLSTPKQTPAEKLKFAKTVIAANEKGLEADHDIPIGRTGAALRKLSPTRRRQYFNRMRAALQFPGNQAQNITHRTGEANRARNNEFNKLDKHLKELSKQKFDPFGLLAIKGKNSKNNNKKNGNNRGLSLRNPQNQLALETNNWSDALLLTPSFRYIDTAPDVLPK